MMKGIPVVSLCVATAALGSSAITLQQASGPQYPASAAVAYETRVAALQRDLEDQQAKFQTLCRSVGSLRESVARASPDTFVTLDTSTREFGRVDANCGFFLVSCYDVQPYLNGYKVRLRIGNPLAARFVGFNLAVSWGPRCPDAAAGSDAFSRWLVGLKRRDFSFTDTLQPGRWNEVECVLPQAAASEIGCVRVSIKTNTVSLSVP